MSDIGKTVVSDYFETQLDNIQQMYKHFDYSDIFDTIEETVYTIREMLVSMADEYDWEEGGNS